MLRKIHLNDLDKSIQRNKKQVNEQLVHERSGRRKKGRTRSKGERDALDQISISRWKKAVEKGFVKKLGDRKMYYDHLHLLRTVRTVPGTVRLN